jgi:hypothetical protein
MSYLDLQRLSTTAEQSAEFLNRKPYPWAGYQGVLHADAFDRLTAEMPDPKLFQAEFGKARGYGQEAHNRYALQYRPKLDAELSQPWRDFIGELHAPPYEAFLRRVYGLRPQQKIALSMHWHHASRSGSVSPHTDASRKVGSHIFYFNTPDDWDPAWGGQTVVLDDEGRLRAHAAPGFDSLRQVAASEILGNQSFMFKRTEHSWHGVRPITCPPDRLRKVFIVVVNHVNLQVLWRRMRGKDPDGYPL